MCGPSQQEKNISAAQEQMYKTMSDNYATTFGQQQGITKSLTDMFTPILQAGPTAQGYAPEQLAAMKTEAGEQVTQQYQNAQKATANILASRGGGNTMLPDSISANMTAKNANDMAAARAAAMRNITAQNYAQGNANWNTAAQVLGNTAQIINPLGYGSQSTAAGSEASSTAQAMAQQSNSIWNAAIGAVGGIAGSALGGGGIMSMLKKTPSLPYSTGATNPAPTYSSAPLTSMIPTQSAPLYAGAQ